MLQNELRHRWFEGCFQRGITGVAGDAGGGYPETFTCHLYLNVFLTPFPAQRRGRATLREPCDPALLLHLSSLKTTRSGSQRELMQVHRALRASGEQVNCRSRILPLTKRMFDSFISISSAVRLQRRPAAAPNLPSE